MPGFLTKVAATNQAPKRNATGHLLLRLEAPASCDKTTSDKKISHPR